MGLGGLGFSVKLGLPSVVRGPSREESGLGLRRIRV